MCPMGSVMNINAHLIQQAGYRWRRVSVIGGLLGVLAVVALHADESVLAQSTSGASSVRSFGGGVSPLFKFGGGSLYIDNQ